jgi:hypothetical protein
MKHESGFAAPNPHSFQKIHFLKDSVCVITNLATFQKILPVFTNPLEFSHIIVLENEFNPYKFANSYPVQKNS